MESSEFSHSHFDSQYKPEQHLLFGGKSDMVDIRPETPHPDKPFPVLFVPGITGNPDAYKGSLRMLSHKGRHVLSFSHPRTSDSITDTFDSYKSLVRTRLEQQEVASSDVDTYLDDIQKRGDYLIENYPKAGESFRHALNILGFLEMKDIDQADVVGHSGGGIDAVFAKYLAPTKVGNLVLVETGGLIGKDSGLAVTGRNIKQVLLERDGVFPVNHDIDALGDNDADIKARVESVLADPQRAVDVAQLEVDKLSPGDAMRNVAHYVKGNPLQFVAETRALGFSQIDPLLEHIRKEGAKVGLIHAVDDPTFPMDGMQQSGAVRIDKDGKPGTVDGFVSVLGHHNTHAAEPRTMGWADELLTQLDKKTKAEENSEVNRGNAQSSLKDPNKESHS
ncbi:MAG: alpha/beta hydrolase [Candidatus Levybacteria bacterium]|nr:alpha/beta hydrolase [Candidatus Levybacteria bacterium]